MDDFQESRYYTGLDLSISELHNKIGLAFNGCL